MDLKDKTIEELVSLILMQDKEIKRLQKKLECVMQYIDVYEEYLRRGD